MFREVDGTRLRRVLIVCYDFPGIWGAGVIRTYQLAKELPSFGWEPVILTAQQCPPEEAGNIETSDGRLNSPVIAQLRSRLLVPYETYHHVLTEEERNGAAPQNGALRQMVKAVTQLAVPDGKIAWVPAAAKRARQIAHDRPFEMCFSVSPRPTSHFVGWRVARSLGISWVADYTLPWSDAHWLTARPRPVAWLDRQLERSVVRAANHITVAYADIAHSICGRFGAQWERKVSVIPTGFAEDLFDGETPPEPSKFTILYPGHHFCEEGRYGEWFLRAIDAWIGSNPGLQDKVEFVFTGKLDPALLRERALMAHPEVIRVEPLISHRACIQAIRSSDVCVVNTVRNRIPGKVYECMAAGKPVLALSGPGSDLESLMRGYPKGFAVSPQDIRGITNFLQQAIQRGRSEGSGRSGADKSVEMYSSRKGAQRLSRIFEDLLRSGGARRGSQL